MPDYTTMTQGGGGMGILGGLLGGTQFADSAPGILGQGPNDPKTMANLALAAGLIRGDFGGGLLGAGQAYQGQQDALLKRQDLAQQIQLRNIALQQQQQEWAAIQPALAAYAARQAAGAGGAPAASSQPAIPPMSGGPIGSGTAGIPLGGQVAQAAPSSGASGPNSADPFSIDNILQGRVIGMLGGAPASAAYFDQLKPTDLMKTLAASGTRPGTPEYAQALRDNVSKSNYIAPVNARPGSIIRDPRDPSKVLAFNPHVPDGTMPQFDANGNVVAYQPIGNAEAAMAMGERAKRTGLNQATPSVVYVNGRPQFSTVDTDVKRAAGIAPTVTPTGAVPAADPTRPQAPQPGERAMILGDELKAAQGRLSNAKTPDEVQRALGDISGLQREMKSIGASVPASGAAPATGNVTPLPDLGAKVGAEAQQTGLAKDYADQKAAHQQAQITNSYLDNIVQLSQKAATGPQSDKLQYVNGLLSLVGDERAKDAVTANNLLDKYSNQIVARLGTGGLGTDAARTLLSSAYPNAHMTPQAIADAAANLKGANNMVIARTNLLAPYGDKLDPVGYNTAARQFDQNADPRIWQYMSIQDPAARKAFAASVLKADPTFPNRIKALESLGAIK